MSESPLASRRLELGEILLRTTRLEPEQLERARQRQLESRERLADILVSEGMLNPQEVQGAVAEQLGLSLRDGLDPDEVDETIALRVPIGFAKQHRLIATGRTDDDEIRVVAANPLDTAPLDDLRLLFDGSEIALELATERVILGAINLVYDRGTTATDQLAEEASDDLDHLALKLGEPQDLLEATDDAPIIRLVNSMLQHAVKERASDIHIEPFEKGIRVRFRIDDVLYEPM